MLTCRCGADILVNICGLVLNYPEMERHECPKIIYEIITCDRGGLHHWKLSGVNRVECRTCHAVLRKS